MKLNLKAKVQQAKAAIDAVHGDTKVHLSETLEALQEIHTHVQSALACTAEDLEAQQEIEEGL